MKQYVTEARSIAKKSIDKTKGRLHPLKKPQYILQPNAFGCLMFVGKI